MHNQEGEEMQITFLSKEQDWENETTRYWFTVDGTEFCISDTNGYLSLLDSEGYPIEECNDHGNIKDALIPEYEKHIKD